MGQIATIAGAGIGFLIGGPIGAQIGAMVGGMVGNELGPATDGPRLADLSVSTSSYGNAIPRLFGTARLSTNMIWALPIKEHKKTTGGLGGKGGPKQNSFTYTASFAVAMCVGPIDGILRIWADGKLIYGEEIHFPYGDTQDTSDPDFVALVIKKMTLGKGKGSILNRLRIYRGSEDQLPDSVIEADKGVGNTPAYRGLAYLVFEDLPLEDYGQRIPQITVEVTKAKAKSFPFVPPRQLDGSIFTSGAQYPDYESDTLWIKSDTDFRPVSMSTMQEIPHGAPQQPLFPEHYNCRTYLPGCNMYFFKEGLSNSAAVGYCIPGGSGFTMLGNRSNNSFDESPVRECVGTWPDPSWAANGELGAIRVKGQPCIINRSGFNSGSIYMVEGNKAEFVDFCLAPGKFLRMGEFAQYSEFVFWANINNKLYFKKYQVNGRKATHAQVATPNPNCLIQNVYTANGGVAFSELFLQIPSRNDPEIALDITSFESCAWDSGDNSYVVFGRDVNGDNFYAKYLIDQSRWAWVHSLPDDINFPSQTYGDYTRLVGGKLGYCHSFPAFVTYIDLQSGEIADNTPQAGFNWTNAFWDDQTQSLYSSYAPTPITSTLNRVFRANTSNTVNVAGIVEEICADTKLLSPGEYDTSTMPDIPVVGYVISRECSARDALGQLASAYFFDGVESDYKIKFIPRGLASKVIITEAEMGNVSDRDVQLKETVGQEIEVPMRIVINYMDVDRDYQTSSQFAKRITNPFPTMNSRLEVKSEFPIVLSATEAKQLADKGLKMVWANRTTSEFVLPWKFLLYDPTDVVTVTLDNGTTRDIRMAKIDTGDDLTLHVAGVSESQTAYFSDAIGHPGDFPIQNVAIYPPVKVEVIATPLLRDSDNPENDAIPVVYLAAYAPSNVWGGAFVVKQGLSGPVDIDLLDTQAVIGICETTLPAVRAWGSLDTTSRLIVKLYAENAELESCTLDDLLAGANAALVGNEVIQYQDADMNDDGTWTISNILRGRRTTDRWIASHRSAERFIVLDTLGSIHKSNMIDDPVLQIKGVAPGNTPENVFYKTVEAGSKAHKDPAPSSFSATDDGTTATVTFAPRSQRAFGIIDLFANNPSDEHTTTLGVSRRYVWTVFAGSNNALVEGAKTENALEQKLSFFENLPTALLSPLPGIEGFTEVPNNDGGFYMDTYSIEVPLTNSFENPDRPGCKSFFLTLNTQAYQTNGSLTVAGESGFPAFALFEQDLGGKWDVTEYF